jgi:hypothetical protein
VVLVEIPQSVIRIQNFKFKATSKALMGSSDPNISFRQKIYPESLATWDVV